LGFSRDTILHKFYIEAGRKKLNQEVYKNILLGLKISAQWAGSIQKKSWYYFFLKSERKKIHAFNFVKRFGSCA
jgi:hypothetical protein